MAKHMEKSTQDFFLDELIEGYEGWKVGGMNNETATTLCRFVEAGVRIGKMSSGGPKLVKKNGSFRTKNQLKDEPEE